MSAVTPPFLVSQVASASSQQQLPINDMHLPTLAADDQGPPPVAICTPISSFPDWDAAGPFDRAFIKRARLHSALTLEEVPVRYPRLRV